MSEFTPVTTMSELNLLNEDDILQGYRDGLWGWATPDSTKSRGWHHGYANAMVDTWQAKITPEQAKLAREYVKQWRAH